MSLSINTKKLTESQMLMALLVVAGNSTGQARIDRLLPYCKGNRVASKYVAGLLQKQKMVKPKSKPKAKG